jgi:hypothetical protein
MMLVTAGGWAVGSAGDPEAITAASTVPPRKRSCSLMGGSFPLASFPGYRPVGGAAEAERATSCPVRAS